MAVYEFKPPRATTVEELVLYLETELKAVYQALAEVDALDLRVTHVEPKRPRDGMVVFADGTDWDPGAGRGLYVYDGGWVKSDAEALAAVADHAAEADPHAQYLTEAEGDAAYAPLSHTHTWETI